MNLAKWLMINKSIRQIGGERGRFVLPIPTATAGSDIKSILYPRLIEKNFHSETKERQPESNSDNDYSREISNTADKHNEHLNKIQTKLHVIQQNRVYTSDNVQSSLFDSTAQSIEEKQLTLDDWKLKEKNNTPRANSESVQSFSRVGRWALKRGLQKVPKPPPIQTEFQLKSIQVVKNDLNYSDIEIVAKPVKGKFTRFIANLCSLTSQSVVKLIKKIRL
ncbi:MAG: hypothetical protein N2487_04690 [Verrucomicrobiae bacterium]|nr:hypothetical protein [Verrucomicrobiae bacterium]